jgi:hypothetical protein
MFDSVLLSADTEFVGIFEALIEGFLKQKGVTSVEFYQELRRSMEGGNAPWASEGAKEIVALAYEASDFQHWASKMRKKTGHK